MCEGCFRGLLKGLTGIQKIFSGGFQGYLSKGSIRFLRFLSEQFSLAISICKNKFLTTVSNKVIS